MREYITRYNETALEFVQRLLAEEGIGYFLGLAGERAESITLFDGVNAFLGIPSHPEGRMHVRGHDGDLAADESIRHLEYWDAEHSTHVAFDDWDWTRPGLELQQRAAVPGSEGAEREDYHWPLHRTVGDYSAGQKSYAAEDGALRVETRKQQAALQWGRGEGQSNAVMLKPRLIVDVQGHGDDRRNGRQYAVKVRHSGVAPHELTHDARQASQSEAQEDQYQNEFVVYPVRTVWRPEPVARRSIAGYQTAVVTGPEGEEIFTDEHGRIKVQFHWDRGQVPGESRSRWIRVAQLWSGQGWGFQFIPRIGMEVVVVFEEGDPDRPLVVGCVYNGTHAYPWEMPENKTQSGVRTNTSPENGGANILRFEDKRGREQVFLEAQRDLDIHVKRRSTRTVDQNENVHITGFRDTMIQQSETKTIRKMLTTTVDQNELRVVNQNRTTRVAQNETLTVQGQRAVQVVQLDKEEYDNERHTRVNGWEKLTVTGHRWTGISGNDHLEVNGTHRTHAAHKVECIGNEEVRLEHGPLRTTLNAAGTSIEGADRRIVVVNSSGRIVADERKVQIIAEQELSLVCGSASIVMRSNGTVQIHASQKIELTVGASEVCLEPARLRTNGVEVQSTAVGNYEISGALIKLN